MYLSRVKLDTELRATKKALANPQVMHAIVAGCFETSIDVRPLWRIDTLRGSTYMLVVSAATPDFTSLVDQLSSPENAEVSIRDYTKFLSQINNSETFKFRLNANPVRSTKRSEKSSESLAARGKIYGHVTVEHQLKWLQDRAAKHGFELVQFDVVSRGERRFKRENATVTLTVACFEGILQVSDATLLREALAKGIGRAKAYGCGLMTVARL